MWRSVTLLWSFVVVLGVASAVLVPSGDGGGPTSLTSQERQEEEPPAAMMQVLEFDVERVKPEYESMTNLLALKRICADNASPDGLKILFSNRQYDMVSNSGAFVINFPLILEGESFESEMIGATQNITVQEQTYGEAVKGEYMYQERRFGAFGPRPIFANMPSIAVRSSNVQFNGLTIRAGSKVKYVINLFSPRGRFPTDGWAYGWENISIRNVELSGGFISVYLGNGAGVSVEHTTVSNFRRKGILGDRFMPVVGHYPVIVRNCYLKPQLPADFRVRGTAFDAGNDEYPFLWNHKDLWLESNLYDGVGMGYSKGANGVVRRNVFRSLQDADSEAIHLEEFSQGVEVRHNVIDFGTERGIWLNGKRITMKGIYLDRITQRVRDIRFLDNKIVGTFDLFFGGRAMYNITIQGNDFTEAFGRKGANSQFLNFDYDEGSTAENDLYEMGSEAIVMDETNLGVEGRRSELGVMRIREHGANSNALADFLREEFIDNVQLVQSYDSQQPLADGQQYRIIHIQSGRPLMARLLSGELKMGNVGATGARSIWTAYLKEDYFYSFHNNGTNNYLESDRHYTITNLVKTLLPVGQKPNKKNPGRERFYPFCRRTYAEKLTYQAEQRIVAPMLALQKLDPDQTGYELLLGGNERKTRITFEELDLAPDASPAVVLEYAKKKNPEGGPMIPILPDASDLWEFVPV